MSKVQASLERCGRQSHRHRKLPAHLMVYYVIALALYMQVCCSEVLRCLMEGLQWLGWETGPVRRASRAAISKARARLGCEPVQALYEELAGPIAQPEAKGAFYRKKWRVVTLDGSSLDVADTPANEGHFGRPAGSRGKSGFPQLRFIALVENGTHVLFGARMGGQKDGEKRLAWESLCRLRAGMLCLADRGFYGFELWVQALKTKADLLWRVKKSKPLPCLKRLPDGSFLSKVYPSPKARKRDRNGIQVRVVEYRLKGFSELYRLITTILDPAEAPAQELAALYHERWEIETAFDEFKTHLRGGSRIILRSRQPQLVVQEFYGLMMAHFAIRHIMLEAAMLRGLDTDRISFTHTVQVLRRKLPAFAASPPSAP